MAKKIRKKKKKRKLRVKVLAKLLLLVILISLVVWFFGNIKTKNIYINGNTLTKDEDIIKVASLQDYPKIFKINVSKAQKSIKTLPLVKDAKIKRNLFGKLTINITENNVLFYYQYANKYATSDGTLIEDNNEIKGYPTLINFTPDTVFDELIKGLGKIDMDIIKMINEFEYIPYKSKDGKVIDETRFKLKMNDGNTVIIDTTNIKKLNKYSEIYISLDMDKTKGTLYLDTITEENIFFETYDAASKTAEATKENENKGTN